jgi:tetratricopeptide (TPR) repeat protein
MTRRILQLILMSAWAAGVHAATNEAAFEALLIRPDGSSQRAYIVTATKVSIRYREARDSNEVKDLKVSDLASIHVIEPPGYAAAIDLFQDRRYQEAKTAFAALRKSLEAVSNLPDNPGTLSAFHELECLRKLEDLEGLSEELKKFNKDPLVRENHLRQIEMYVFWDAVRTKNWNRLDALAKDRAKQRLPGYQRAQVSYCHALALEALGRPDEALDAYNTSLVADVGASEEIARKSALAILRLHLADPAVKEALKQPAPTTEPTSGQTRLAEARAVAKLFELSLGAGDPLPEEFRMFLQ